MTFSRLKTMTSGAIFSGTGRLCSPSGDRLRAVFFLAGIVSDFLGSISLRERKTPAAETVPERGEKSGIQLDAGDVDESAAVDFFGN